MNRLKQKFGSFSFPTQSAPLLLLLVGILSYGLLFQKLGYFWDEWPIQWIANRLGPEGLALYFETNRPFWGLIYRFTTSLLGGDLPWVWQIFGLIFHWLAACGLWMTIRQAWPRTEAAALWTGLLFLVYPGFRQSPIAFMYGHFFVVYAAFTWSLALSLFAVRRGGFQPLLISSAILLSLVNLLSLEYFFVLELLRPVLLWLASNSDLPRRKRIIVVLKTWLPYLLLIVAVIFWRTVIFSYQTHNYQPTLLSRFSADPFAATLNLAGTVLKDLGMVTFSAWNDIFKLPSQAILGTRSFLVAVAAILASLLVLIVYFLKLKSSESQEKHTLFQVIGFGFVAVLAAGLPFWLTDLPVGLGFPNDRFTLPFIFGVSLFITSLVFLLPGGKLVRILILAFLTSLSIGLQFQNGVAYQRDWNTQRNLFWQMSWRIPSLEPGTAVVTSQVPLKYFSDNSLAAPLNWIYDTDRSSKAGGGMDYMFYDAAVRSTRALKLVKNNPILQGYLAADFEGNTNQLVVIDFKPPACFRVLDAEIDPLNPDLSPIMREASAFSNLAPIQLDGKPAVPKFAIFGSEPEHGWCYYFEKADLARQRGDWAEAVRLGEIAFASGDYPNDPAERMVFIEAYAHTGNWQRALALTEETVRISGLMKPSLSRLWLRIENETPSSPQRFEVLQTLSELLNVKQ